MAEAERTNPDLRVDEFPVAAEKLREQAAEKLRKQGDDLFISDKAALALEEVGESLKKTLAGIFEKQAEPAEQAA